MLNRIPHFTEIFLLNPRLFLKKSYGRILLEVIRSPMGPVPVNIGGYIIETWPSRNDWWKSMYLGCCGIEIAHNIKRHLTQGGVFIDVGAGVGYFSAIAANIVGVTGQVHCFEPSPQCANAIRRMIASNPDSNIILNGYALGVDDDIHNYYIQRSSNSTRVSMVDNVIERADELIEVRAKRLDSYLEEKNIYEVSLIKIDVEGYEYYVLKGLADFFERAKYKPPIICEIFILAYKKSEPCLSELYQYMRSYGYRGYSIFNPEVRIDIRLLRETTDVIFRPA